MSPYNNFSNKFKFDSTQVIEDYYFSAHDFILINFSFAPTTVYH